MKVLIVCMQNIGRSPVLAAIIKKVLGDRGIEGVQVESAGVRANSGARVPTSTLGVCSGAGIDLSEHKARKIDDVALGEYQLIVCTDSNTAIRVGVALRRGKETGMNLIMLERVPDDPYYCYDHAVDIVNNHIIPHLT